MKYRILSLFLAVLMICLMSCGKNENNKTKETAAQTDNVTEEIVSESNDSETNELILANPEDLPEPEASDAIETPHVEFQYPESWKENVRFESTTEENGNYVVKCLGVGSIEGVHCFSIIFGEVSETQDHYNIGELTENGETVPVFTFVNQSFDGLNDEQIDLINATVLSYYMNDLTYQLSLVDGFAVAH